METFVKSSKFEARVQQLLEKWHVPGLAVAIVQDRKTTSRGFGYSTIDPERPCTPDSLFDIASASKSLTAASVALLVDDNDKYPHVQWDTKASQLLGEDFVMSGDGYTENVTVEDILSHRTGLPAHDSSYMGIKAKHPDTAKSVTRNLRNLQVTAPIRSKFQYCNLMFTVATHLIETVTGVSFEKFLHTHFFGPLGMDSTHLQPDASKAAGLEDRIATPYVWEDTQHSYRAIEVAQTPEDQGAGSVITSVNDYIKYVSAMLYQEDPISEQMRKGLIKPRIFVDPENDDANPFTSWVAYAAGWEPHYYRGHLIVMHDGCISGFGSTHFFLPEHDFGGVVLGNIAEATEVAPIIARELIDEVLNVPVDVRSDWDAITSRRFSEYKENGKVKLGEVRQELCPGSEIELQPQTLPLAIYTGTYSNAGYHELHVEERNGRLFIDASDRSMGFTLSFDHVCDQTKYIVHLSDVDEGGDDPFAGEFKLEGDKITAMGLKIEPDLDEYIWFDRLDIV